MIWLFDDAGTKGKIRRGRSVVSVGEIDETDEKIRGLVDGNQGRGGQ
jgi:hypothetical protein